MSDNDNNNTKEENKSNKKNENNNAFILYIIVCSIFLLALIVIYLLFSSSIKKSMDYSIKKFELNSQTQLSNYYEFLKETVTNESFESKEFIKNTLEEAFKPNIDLLRETLKDSKDFSINTVTFWLAFLSLIMIIFTILGIYANNKIMESNQKQSELIINDLQSKAKDSIDNIKNEFIQEHDKYIKTLNNDFDNIRNKLNEKKDDINKDIEKIKINMLNDMNTIKDEVINTKDNVKKSEVEINNIKTDLLKEKDTLIENAKKELNEQKDKITEVIEEIKDNAINKVDSIKKEINNNKSEAENLKIEIEKIKEEAEKMLKEMKEEREAQKQEGKTILSEMEKQQKVNDLLNKAWSEINKNNKEEAIKLYTEALEIDPENKMVLNNRSILYSDKYRKTKGEEKYYYNKALLDYNKMININKNYYNAYIGISFLYLNNYEINKNKESLIQAEKYLNEGFKISPNNLELINNYGILLYSKYKENNTITDLNKSEKYLKKAINNSRIKENIGETYYYLNLVYDEYSKLDNNINGYSKEECKKLSNEYLQKSKDLGYKHFMEE